MKYIIMGLLLATGIWAGCSEDTVIPVSGIPNGEKVTLTYSIDEVKMSRSTGETFENTVHTLDVFIFEDENGSPHHQHVEGLNASTGSITLDKAKDEFKENQQYQIHLIANSSRTDWSGITSVTALKQAEETTVGLHLTQAGESGNPPTKFLMYGNGQVILNAESVSATSPIITITLSRAAAKIQVVLEEGFIKDDNGNDTEKLFQFSGDGVQFNFVNYQNTTRYVYDADAKVSATLLNRTDPSNSAKHIQYGNITENGSSHRTITITTYAYANEWQNDQQNTMTHLIVQVPYMKEGGGTEVNNYYKIPVSKSNKLEPNHFYTVHATLNDVGSTLIDDPIELENIQYSVLDWIGQPINIGGGEQPHYLSLNKEELEMKNIDEDNTIIFASSGKVNITGKRVYYFNKYGQETTVSSSIANSVTITPDENINGKIKIDSPVPGNNLIRYIEFTVTNNDPECEPITVIVKQYPQEYITYYMGWYSYRTDFNCNYENINSANNRIAVSWSNSNWSFKNGNDAEKNYFSYFYINKVVRDLPDDDKGYQNSKINYNIDYYYYWNQKIRYDDVETHNPRMYHVQLTSSSKPDFKPGEGQFDYELGIPRKDNDGYTLRDIANNKLVSPSFMIASRLGTVQPGTLNEQSSSYRIAAEHCNQYVEVYYPRDERGYRLKDANGFYLPAVHLDDWRLPTEAELKIIMRYQGTSQQGTAAMDYLLNGSNYWSAKGVVSNSNSNNNGYFIRCVRDHYENKEQQ